MVAGEGITIKRYLITASDWTLIDAPPFLVFSIMDARNAGGQDVMIRTDNTDDMTEDVIPAGYARTFRFSEKSARHGLFYAKAVAGSGPLVLVFCS